MNSGFCKKISFSTLFQVVILLLIISLFIWIIVKPSEQSLPQLDTFESEEPPKEHSTELVYKDIDVKPTIYDAGSGTVVSGPELIPSQYLSPWYQAYTGDLKNYYLLDDGASGSAGLQFNMCSKSCCSEQYPLPFKMPADKDVCDSRTEFVPTNYMCNNAWQDSGCVCLTKEQANFIGSRGGNA